MSDLDAIIASLKEAQAKQSEVCRRAVEAKEAAWKNRERAQEQEQRAAKAASIEHNKLEAIENAIAELEEAADQ